MSTSIRRSIIRSRRKPVLDSSLVLSASMALTSRSLLPRSPLPRATSSKITTSIPNPPIITLLISNPLPKPQTPAQAFRLSLRTTPKIQEKWPEAIFTIIRKHYKRLLPFLDPLKRPRSVLLLDDNQDSVSLETWITPSKVYRTPKAALFPLNPKSSIVRNNRRTCSTSTRSIQLLWETPPNKNKNANGSENHPR